ncbi:glycosyltransferase involved in cell wall biosynthesis [Ralstonia sp. 151470066-2]
MQNLPPSRPRVAYVITSSEIGGAQSHLADLLHALRGRIDAVVLAGGNGPLLTAAKAAGAKTVRLPLLDNALSPLKALATLRQLKAALHSAAPDLIHVHSAKAGALGRVAAWMLGIPVIYTVHGFAFKPAAPLVRRLASRVVEWCLAPLTTHMICVANAEYELAASLPVPASRVSVIHNGIPDTHAHPEPGGQLRRIVMVARFAAPKRPDIVIRAFARAALDRCELVIAGDGPTRNAMHALADKLAPGRVSFPGNVNDVAGLLASAQLFVLASDHEGLPLSVLEAMRAGLPVVASDLPGIREQFGTTPAALVVGNDEAVMADILVALATDPARRKAMGQAARKRWEQAFGIAPMAEATWQIYQGTLGLPPTTPQPTKDT